MLAERTQEQGDRPQLPRGCEIYENATVFRLVDDGTPVLAVPAPAVVANRAYIEDALARVATHRREMIRAGRAAWFAARIGDTESESEAIRRNRVAHGLYDSAVADALGCRGMA